MSFADLRDAMPDEIREVWFNFDWDIEKAWAVEAKTGELRVKDLAWLLCLPIWRHTNSGRLWSVRPIDVLVEPNLDEDHTRRIEQADLSAPVTAMTQHGRLLLLDGYHRLARASRDGVAAIPARTLDRTQIANIQPTDDTATSLASPS